MSEVIELPLSVYNDVEFVDTVKVTTLWSDGDNITFKVEEK